jgi:hypothetical protein
MRFINWFKTEGYKGYSLPLLAAMFGFYCISKGFVDGLGNGIVIAIIIELAYSIAIIWHMLWTYSKNK